MQPTYKLQNRTRQLNSDELMIPQGAYQAESMPNVFYVKPCKMYCKWTKKKNILVNLVVGIAQSKSLQVISCFDNFFILLYTSSSKSLVSESSAPVGAQSPCLCPLGYSTSFELICFFRGEKNFKKELRKDL